MYEGIKKVTFAECNIEISNKIFEYLAALFKSTMDKTPLLQHDATKSTMILPVQYTSDIVAYIIDDNVLRRLQNMQVINWCNSIRNLTPLPVKTDGNSLAHSVSVYIFGVQDDQLYFRHMIYSMMFSQSSLDSELYIRLMTEHDDVLKLILLSKPSFHGRERTKNFDYYLARCSRKEDEYGRLMPLEPVHVFVLANIIARPIIVYTQWRGGNDEETVQSIRFEGIYLPLLRKDPKVCEKSPIILGYDGGTFVPLLSTENVDLNQWSVKPAGHAQHCASLMRIDGSKLPVRFLKAQEKNNVDNILYNYFDIVEIPTGPKQFFFAAMLKFKAPIAQSIELLWSTLEKVNKYIEQDRDKYVINPSSPNANFQQIQQQIPCSRQKAGMCEMNAFASGNNDAQMCDDCYNKFLAAENTVKQRRQKPSPMPRQVSPVNNQNYDQIVRKCLQCNVNDAFPLLDNMCKSCYDKQVIKNYKEKNKDGNYMTMKAPPRPSKQLVCNLCEALYLDENEFGLCPDCLENNRKKQEEVEAERKRNQPQGELPYAGAASGVSSAGLFSGNMEEYKCDRKKLVCAVPGCLDIVSASSPDLCQKHYDQDRKKVKCTLCTNQAENNEYGLCLVCLNQQSNAIEELKRENANEPNVNIGRGAVNHPQGGIDDMNDFMSSLPMVPEPGDYQGNQMPFSAPYQNQQYPPLPEHRAFNSPTVYEGYTNADQKYGRQQGAMNWQKDKINPKCNYCARPSQPGKFGMCADCARKKNGRQPVAEGRKCGNPDRPSCKNMVYDPDAFMCVDCIDDQREAMKKLSGINERGPQEQEQYYPEVPPQYNRYPQYPQPNPYAEMGQAQGHYQVPNQYPGAMQIDEQMPFDDQMQIGALKQEKCKAFDCEFYGNPEYGGHCSSCFQEKTKNEARRQGRDFDPKIQANDLAGEQISYAGFGSAGSGGIQNVVYPPVPPINSPPVSPLHAPPQAQQMGYGFNSYGAAIQPIKCRNPNCEMYGRSEWDGMCSQCFKANRLERD